MFDERFRETRIFYLNISEEQNHNSYDYCSVVSLFWKAFTPCMEIKNVYMVFGRGCGLGGGGYFPNVFQMGSFQRFRSIQRV